MPVPFLDAVDACLAETASRFTREAHEISPDTRPFIEAAVRALTGGKRLRARFAHVAHWAVTGTTQAPSPLVSVGAALEAFHAAALVHDDIIDNSDTRRGGPAAHRALEAHHRDASWLGDPAAFGRSSAILLGDLLVAWSDDLLEEGLAESPTTARPTREEYALMRRTVTVGQYLDIAEESAWAGADEGTGVERALRIAAAKSARYSVQQPLLIGAALAGATPAQHSALAEFGLPLGLAFQLRDDLLGVFGEEVVTGKPAGDDLREGKRTALVAFARDALPNSSRRILDELLGDPELTSEQIASLQATIRDTGAVDRVEQLISRYAQQADRALIGAELDNAAVAQLRDLARATVDRSA